MSRLFYHVMQDNVGNLLFDVSGTMRLAGSGTLATIYGDEALTVILPNPMTNHPSFGSFKCFLGAGDYDFYMAKAGYTFETLTGVQGHGTMAQQDASAVAITGGAATLTNLTTVGALPSFGHTALGGVFDTAFRATVQFDRSAGPGLCIRCLNTDTGNAHINFKNQFAVDVGTISCTGSATAYNTASDARLKHAITALTGALGVVQALRPVAFLWNADGSAGRGFIASEVQEWAPEAVTGEPEAVDAEGNIVPQGLDMSKLVPYLVGAVQMLAEQVQALTARLEAAGA